MVSTPRNVVSPEHGVSTPMLRASPEHGLRIISFITGLTNNAVPSRSIATPQHHVVISILPHSMVSTPRDVVSPEHGLSTHVTLLVQSMVSAPLRVLVQEHGLRIVSGVSNQTASSACGMDRQVMFRLPH